MKVEFTIEGPPVGKARPRVTRTVTYTPKKKLNKQLKKMVEVMQGVYKDDRQVTKLLVVKRYADRPRVEVRIKRDMGD